MIDVHATTDSGTSSRFGAAHRVYFDTPPLKGLRLEPFRFHLQTSKKQELSQFVVPFGTAPRR